MNPLAKRIGPWPLGAWFIILGGGLGLGLVINRRMAASDTALGPEGGALPSAGLPLGPDGALYVNQVPSSQAAADLLALGLPQSLADWQRQAERTLAAQGQDPVLVHNAITHAILGDPLTNDECRIMTTVLKQSPPPESFPALDCPAVPTSADLGYSYGSHPVLEQRFRRCDAADQRALATAIKSGSIPYYSSLWYRIPGGSRCLVLTIQSDPEVQRIIRGAK